MPRRYYRRTRVIRPKKKWATNILNFTSTGHNSQTETTGILLATDSRLCRNNQQVTNPTPVILKAGNFKVQGSCTFATGSGGSAVVQVTAYVLFKPEGIDWYGSSTEINPQAVLNTIGAHPEWVMGCRAITTQTLAANTNSEPVHFSFSSRLKRNLNSGDMITFVMIAKNLGTGSNLATLMADGIVQFWTCSN